MRTRPLPWKWFALASLWLAGCGGGAGSAAPPATAPGAAAAGAEKAVTTKADGASKIATGPEYIYQYNPVGKRDPFRNPLADEPTSGSASQGRTLCTDPLCQWDVDQLTLVAVVSGDANPLAMVEDSGGRGHIVRRNTKIGRKDGRVTQILRNEVIITEYWQQPDGKTKPNPVSMKLKDDPSSVAPVDMFTGQPYQ